jgi:hypothetical protein
VPLIGTVLLITTTVLLVVNVSASKAGHLRC